MYKRFPRLLAVSLGIVVLGGCGTSTGGATRVTSADAASRPKIITSIHLPGTTIAGGATVTGFLEIVNGTGKAVSLTTGNGCRPHWAVGLENAKVHFTQLPFPADCVASPLVIVPGVNKVPFTMATKYVSCVNKKNDVATALPLCLAGAGLPPLPRGTYNAVLVSDSSSLPPASPVALRIV